MSNRFERAQAVLAALNAGAHVARQRHAAAPLPRPRAPRPVLCRNCGLQIVLANLPSGKAAPLDRVPDTGRLVIVDGTAVTRGPQHGAANRFEFHRCPKGLA